MEVSPLQFYSGEMLKGFVQDSTPITKKENTQITRLYFEANENIPTNMLLFQDPLQKTPEVFQNIFSLIQNNIIVLSN
jgi:hypothetical protein